MNTINVKTESLALAKELAKRTNESMRAVVEKALIQYAQYLAMKGDDTLLMLDVVIKHVEEKATETLRSVVSQALGEAFDDLRQKMQYKPWLRTDGESDDIEELIEE